MLELELIINQISRQLLKEKSLRKKIYLEEAVKSLKEYEKLP